MYNIVVNLYVISFNIDLGEQCFVSIENSTYVPLKIDIPDKDARSISEILQEIFEQHINLGFGWVNTKLIDCEKNEDSITISYACSIPPGTSLKESFYISKNIAVVNRLARKSLYYV